MDILQKIVQQKSREIALKKSLVPPRYLEHSPLFERQGNSLSQALQKSGSGIIAEFKRRSPSRPKINQHSPVQEVAAGYESAGACGMSVLTDVHFFGGSLEDLLIARSTTRFPLLRKEFIIDEYQILEAKAHGADVILLIAAILETRQIKDFTELAGSLGLEILLEVHDEAELKRAFIPGIQMVGVNNRNLKTFEVSLETSKRIAPLIPEAVIKVSESGISRPEAIKDLRKAGFRGFLIGEHFMAADEPGIKAMEFIKAMEP
ncbi:indole-3-glycerol phosphate synthase [Muriicola jejuensis]|uniref:Indole-3-glycerol phosphate synthase n=1 Tax=Muriicola jejuensis TaxID=504488 RepID=A0A6P0UBF4_9FLAO|nr:indole-3-glycerol phosphate synthase TrpC [Muriicola jejuensis]NER09219.1 indole-3-glycerol phosphate synthase TrpC [Muriicola jejuensis]SMP10168.1 indole-3-glycerol phosphate synthase [Muriicola jejuensis]